MAAGARLAGRPLRAGLDACEVVGEAVVGGSVGVVVGGNVVSAVGGAVVGGAVVTGKVAGTTGNPSAVRSPDFWPVWVVVGVVAGGAVVGGAVVVGATVVVGAVVGGGTRSAALVGGDVGGGAAVVGGTVADGRVVAGTVVVGAAVVVGAVVGGTVVGGSVVGGTVVVGAAVVGGSVVGGSVVGGRVVEAGATGGNPPPVPPELAQASGAPTSTQAATSPAVAAARPRVLLRLTQRADVGTSRSRSGALPGHPFPLHRVFWSAP